MKWHARVWNDGLAVHAAADVAETDYASMEEVAGHAWWMGVQVGDRVRWLHGSSAKSENGLVDDLPGVDPLWVDDPMVPIRVLLHLELDDDAGDTTTEQLAWEGRVAGEEQVTLEPASFELPSVIEVQIDDRSATTPPPELHPKALVPGHGVFPNRSVICHRIDDDSWVLWNETSATTLEGFAPGAYAKLEYATPGPDGLLAVVWLRDERWHLHVYRLPDAKPIVEVAPEPAGNGNPPMAGFFARDGSGLLFPVLTNRLGWLDLQTKRVEHRFKVDALNNAALDVHEGKAWYVGAERKLAFDLTTGERVFERKHTALALDDPPSGYRADLDRYVLVETLSYEPLLSSVVWIDGNEMHQCFIDAVVDEQIYVRSDGSFVSYGRGLLHVQPGKGGTRFTKAGGITFGASVYADDESIEGIGISV